MTYTTRATCPHCTRPLRLVSVTFPRAQPRTTDNARPVYVACECEGRQACTRKGKHE